MEPSPEDLSDGELLEALVTRGGRLLASAKDRVAKIGSITDDPRWGGPIPLRFDSQLAVLFLGALDAYEVTTGILRERASQQAFNGLRFQVEALGLLRWLCEPEEARDRQIRSYRVLYGQISRWVKLLKEDVAGEPDGAVITERAESYEKRLRELAREDGLQHLKTEPDRRYLFTEYVPESGYPTFSMFSELGAHPGAIGNILFSMNAANRTIEYTLDESFVDRAFWSSVAIVHLWQTCETVSSCLDWTEWLETEARPINNEVAPFMNEAQKRRKAAREDR
jgi:hypothetical protein